MKIYTKTGDKGQTSLFSGKRVSKNHARIEAYGTVDELNSYLGLLRDFTADTDRKDFLLQIQQQLFNIGSLLATENPEKSTFKLPELHTADIQLLEDNMDEMDSHLPELKNFVLPGGNQAVSFCHIARTVCRRSERRVIELHEQEPIPENIIRYLNRLSDYLFMLARKMSQELEIEEVKWVNNNK